MGNSGTTAAAAGFANEGSAEAARFAIVRRSAIALVLL